MVKPDVEAPVTLQMLNEAVDAILAGMERMVGAVKNELRSEIQSAKHEIKAEIGFIKDRLNTIEADTPSRGEFETLKRRVIASKRPN